ncbi:MAG: hypothetical protein ABL898_16070 [Hyphomicrobiaceae bacterium]|nr:hypothetical protein [Hyphomicrobiaceae bacterium]
MNLRTSLSIIAVAAMMAGCAAPRPVVVSQFQKPETMSPVDMKISMAECEKQGLLARKDYIATHPGAPQSGFDSPVFKAQQAAKDKCLAARGIMLTSRTRKG